MDEWIIHIVEQGGYLGIFLLMVLENVFPPIPSEFIMGMGGVLVARGSMSFWPLLIWGTVGSTLGNYCWFLAGHRLGYERLRPLVRRWGRWLTLDWGNVESATRFFQRHGQWVVFVMRFSPLLRTIISLPAGLSHMGHVRFLLFTFAGAAIWNTACIAGGHWLARYLDLIEHVAGPVVIAIVAVAIAAYVWRVVRWKPEGTNGEGR